MSPSKEERDRILALIEVGQVSAAEAAQLLDALDHEAGQRTERARERVSRTGREFKRVLNPPVRRSMGHM